MSQRILAIAALAVALPAFIAMTTGQTAQSANPATATSSPSPVLIELFTSEGCSSCPPADGLIQKLDEFQPIPGAQLVVLSEHVTYWDHDGWKDPNSSQALTDRQSAYEPALGEKTSYTPQMIVDGTEQVALSDPQKIEDALVKAKTAAKVAIRIGETKIEGGSLQTHIETDVNTDKRNADVFLAVALDRVESQVLRGENGGHHLVHVAVVQQLTKVGKLPKGKNFAQDIQLKLKGETDLAKIRLVAFAQEPGPGKVLGVALRKSGQ